MDQRPADGGPIYAETDLSALFSEPWNAFSSLAILLPAVYWAIKLKGDFRTYPFIFYCIPLLFLGGLGSTLFHAFRASKLLLLMDVLPTALLTLSVSVYFWTKILSKKWMLFLVIAPLIVLRVTIFQYIPQGNYINAGYLITGFMIFIPVIPYLFKSNFHDWPFILGSISMLVVALIFRERDLILSEWLPMGSHFLWHILSGIGAYFLAQYLFNLRRLELKQTETL